MLIFLEQEERRKQIEKVLSGNENWHEERVEKALSIITQFNLPINTAPEKYIWEMLNKSTDESEYVECAKRIKAVSDTHEYIGKKKRWEQTIGYMMILWTLYLMEMIGIHIFTI